jgi:hypothetical protein
MTRACPRRLGNGTPGVIVNLTGSGTRLRASSSSDTALAVLDQNDGWHCNDDTDGNNPDVTVAPSVAGTYRVWVTSYRSSSFDYAPTEAVPDSYDDRKGYHCPIGAHIRRMNPRHSTVAGHSGLKRRIIRSGLPYGPPYDPATPHDGIERGLLGLFIGVSLKDQFEFVMSDCANKGTFAPGL